MLFCRNPFLPGHTLPGLCVLCALGAPHAWSQTALPGIQVSAPSAPATVHRKRTVIAARGGGRPSRPTVARAARMFPTVLRGIVPAPTADAKAGLAMGSTAAFDHVRDFVYAHTGANAYPVDRTAIENGPQGADRTFDKVLLQTPGVTQDSAASGEIHIRNEHANLQYRINGIMLPDGISGFGQFIETSFVGRFAVLTGALPAQYGLRTAGVIDITSREGAVDGGGTIGLYGGSRGTLNQSIQYGGTAGSWDYFVTGRFTANRAGIENPSSNLDPIHDRSQQGRYFAYASNRIDDATRLTFISGAFSGRYQIPDNPGQNPSFTAFGISNFDSTWLNERQTEQSVFNVVAFQKSVGPLDFQIAAFSRTSALHFMPDALGDLLFNGAATDVFRGSSQSGIQADGAWRQDASHTWRFGLSGSVERSRVVNSATLLPLDGNGGPVDAPFGTIDRNVRTGGVASVYIQHEWKISEHLTLNEGARFDQSLSYTDANQLSPRAGFVWMPGAGTTIHGGYARYFTPPPQTLAAPTNLALYATTTLQPDLTLSSPVRPERSHYIDFGIDQVLAPGITFGIDGYYKRARNLVDDGQFGQALVLTAFNYDRAYNIGLEAKANADLGTVRLHGSVAWARQRATSVSSNQFLFDAVEYGYIASHYVYTDHAQTWTASAGGAWDIRPGTKLSADMIYGSGLRNGFANTEHVSPYAQVNLGATQEIRLAGAKLTTLRVDIVNLLDHTYQLRDGSGIGVFAPQYGPRRGIFAGLSQKF
jgi:hypothetical protein